MAVKPELWQCDSLTGSNAPALEPVTGAPASFNGRRTGGCNGRWSVRKCVPTLERGNERKRVVAWLVKLLGCRELPTDESAAAGEALAKLGDPREEIATLEGMAFCHVPGGNFMMGEKGDEDAELHENDCLKTGYWIGKYPVTQRQFSFFAKDGGYEKERYWAEARRHGYWIERGLETCLDSTPRKKPLRLSRYAVKWWVGLGTSSKGTGVNKL